MDEPSCYLRANLLPQAEPWSAAGSASGLGLAGSYPPNRGQVCSMRLPCFVDGAAAGSNSACRSYHAAEAGLPASAADEPQGNRAGLPQSSTGSKPGSSRQALQASLATLLIQALSKFAQCCPQEQT